MLSYYVIVISKADVNYSVAKSQDLIRHVKTTATTTQQLQIALQLADFETRFCLEKIRERVRLEISRFICHSVLQMSLCCQHCDCREMIVSHLGDRITVHRRDSHDRQTDRQQTVISGESCQRHFLISQLMSPAASQSHSVDRNQTFASLHAATAHKQICDF